MFDCRCITSEFGVFRQFLSNLICFPGWYKISWCRCFLRLLYAEGWVCGWKPWAKIVGAYAFEASSGRIETKVAKKSPIVPISMVSRFVFVLIIFARFRDFFENFFSLNAFISESRISIGTICKCPFVYDKDSFCPKNWQKFFLANRVFSVETFWHLVLYPPQL